MGYMCTATLKVYSKKHGYSLRVIPDFTMPDQSLSWHRINLILELFDEGFDFVFWMDPNALFLRYDRDIREVIEPGKDLSMVHHSIPEELRPPGLSSDEPIPNTGIMLLRNCKWVRDFLEEVWNREEYRDHLWGKNAGVIDLLGLWCYSERGVRYPWGMNAAVLDLLGYFGLLGKGEDQPNKDLLDHIKFIDLEWNSLPSICSALHPLVHHYEMQPLQLCIEKMTRDFLLSTTSLSEDLDSIFYRIGTHDGFVVQQGPFAGMAYLSQVRGHYLLRGSVFLPKLLGIYEAELHDVLADIATKPYATVVNVGCGEGYYAVGLARLLQHAHIYAFDSDQRCQEWCAEMARLNNVTDRVTIAGTCDLEQLHVRTTEPALLIVDCEGFELNLMQPDALPGLSQCDVLVELHDFINPIISHTILERFAPTHTITIIDCKEHDPADTSAMPTLSAQEQLLASEEFRPARGIKWAFMTPTNEAARQQLVSTPVASKV